MTTRPHLGICTFTALGFLMHLHLPALAGDPDDGRDAVMIPETKPTSAPADHRWDMRAIATSSPDAGTFILAADQRAPEDQCDCHAEAMKWYLLGAEQGQAGAQYNLGLIYASGKGVPQDYTEAIKWYRLAAEQGHADAQYNLGLIYAKGESIAQDLVQAYLWLDLAAAQGGEKYAEALEQTASIMTPAQIEEARRLADEWLSKHRE